VNTPNVAAPGGVARRDWALAQWLAEEKGFLCIPASPFFSEERANEGASDGFVRVAFCKTDETIEAAALALQKIKCTNSVPSEEATPVKQEARQR